MIRPLRRYHRIIWIIIALLLSIGFVVAFILSRKFEKFYGNTSMKNNSPINNTKVI
jgi:uncharacterized protein YneF (UPF0154 family)